MLIESFSIKQSVGAAKSNSLYISLFYIKRVSLQLVMLKR